MGSPLPAREGRSCWCWRPSANPAPLQLLCAPYSRIGDPPAVRAFLPPGTLVPIGLHTIYVSSQWAAAFSWHLCKRHPGREWGEHPRNSTRLLAFGGDAQRLISCGLPMQQTPGKFRGVSPPFSHETAACPRGPDPHRGGWWWDEGSLQHTITLSLSA